MLNESISKSSAYSATTSVPKLKLVSSLSLSITLTSPLIISPLIGFIEN